MVDVPSREEFNALEVRVTVLEGKIKTVPQAVKDAVGVISTYLGTLT